MTRLVVVFALLLMVGFSFAADIFTEFYDYSRAFAAVALTATGAWSAYRHMMSTDALAKKEAWETFSHALIGAVIVVMAPVISQVFS